MAVVVVSPVIGVTAAFGLMVAICRVGSNFSPGLVDRWFRRLQLFSTHAMTGAIVGVGSTRRLSAVRWGVAGRIVWAWVLTIPAAAAIGWGTERLLYFLGIQ